MKGGVLCTRHDQTFPKGKACALCFSDPPPPEVEKKPARARRRRGVVSPADHERSFLEIAELAMEWAEAENEAAENWVPPSDDVKVVGGPSRSTAAKLLDCSIKARRAACQLAQWREDWERTDKLEKAALELARRRENRGREVDGGEVRH